MPARNGKPARAAPAAERCVIYPRVSDPGQSTIKEQEQWGRRIAEASGWPVVAVIADEGLSGDDQTRPGLAKLEALFAQNHAAGCPISRLIVQKTDRLSRSDTLDAFEMLARLRRVGLRYVVTTQRTIDLNNRLDRTLYALEQDHSNNPFLATMAERALGGMAAVAQAGFWVGRIPLGYKLVKRPGEHGAGKRRKSGRLAIDPETAPIVRELFGHYAAGWSTVRLARWLTARVRPPKAYAWSPQTVRQLLMNDVYIGVRSFGRRARGQHVRLSANGVVPQDPGLGDNNIEGAFVGRDESLVIVDEPLFRRVQALLAAGRRRGHRNDAQPLPLSGLGKCGCGGGPLYASAKWLNGRGEDLGRRLFCGKRTRFGREACPDGSTGCSHDEVLSTVVNLLFDTLLADGAAERLAELAQERADEGQRQAKACRESLLRRIADLDGKLARSQRRLAEVDADMLEDTQAGIRQLRQEHAEARAELERLDNQKAAAAEVDPGRLRAYLRTCREAYCLLHKAAPGGEHFAHPTLLALLAELVVGFTLHWKRGKQGRPVPGRVDVELPAWLTLLASNARSP
jgi:DNA invertase Pin-like site-specific DNA recombinase